MTVTPDLVEPDDDHEPNVDPDSGLEPAAHRRYVEWLNVHGVTTVPRRHPMLGLREEYARLDQRLEDVEWALRHLAPGDPRSRPARRRRDRLEHQVMELWSRISKYDEHLAGWPHYCRQPGCDTPLTKEQAATASLCPRCLSGYGAPPSNSEPPYPTNGEPR